MPFPSYIPRSDSFGNWYFGGFRVDSVVEAGYGAATALTATQAEFNTFLDAALGAGNWLVNGTNYYFRFNNAYETLTGTISTTANYRFYQSAGGNINYYLNTALSGLPIDINGFFGINFATLWSSGNCAYAVANQYGMWVCTANKTTAGSIGTTLRSVYYGWVKNPVFPTNGPERIRNAIAGDGAPGTILYTSFLAARAAGDNSLQSQCLANSVISCEVATPGANVTELSVLDSSNAYLNIGSAYNALFYPGSNLTPGRLYRIPPAQDPDGNTEQNGWLCAGTVFGWNGAAQVPNAGYKMVRVFTQNIT